MPGHREPFFGLRHTARRRAILATVATVAAALVAVLTPRTAAAQSIEISDGTECRVETMKVRADVESGVAVVDVEQTFRNPVDRALEGVWTIRLPEGAVVRSLTMWMQGREKHGRVLEAGRAREAYDSIVRDRADPALAEEIGFRTFRVSVFPIPAHDTARIRLVWTCVVPDDLGMHALSLPMPSGRGGVASLDVSVRIRSAAGIETLVTEGTPSGVNPPHIERSAAEATVRWAAERVHTATPLSVRWAAPPGRWDISVLAHRQAGAAEGTFLVRAVPRFPAMPDVPRDVVFVVDASGSMSGEKIRQARAALLRGIDSLRDADRFSVVAFSTEAVSLTGEELIAADVGARERARAAGARIDATGGTNLESALAFARRMCGAEAPGRIALVLCLTDGDPTVGETRPDRIEAAWRAAGCGHIRFFALGVGRDVKEFLLSRLARIGRGGCEYVERDDQLGRKLESLYARTAAPVLASPQIEVSGVTVRAVEPRPLPDLFRGGALVFAGRYEGGGRARIVLTGRCGAEQVSVPVDVDLPREPVERPHVAQIWARMRIDRLIEDMRVEGLRDELRSEIVRLGVEHQIVSPYTSFLVVEDGVRIPDAREAARVPEPPGPSAAPQGFALAGGGGGGPTTGGGGGGGALPGEGGAPQTGGSRRGGQPAALDGARPDPADVPPDTREPSDPPPPSSGGGGATPAGGSAPEPAPRVLGPGYDDWAWWWEAERAKLVSAAVRRGRASPQRPTVSAETRSLLRDVAESHDYFEPARRLALEGLARCDGADARTVDLVRRLIADPTHLRADLGLRRTAALAPAWMNDRSPETRTLLLSNVGDRYLGGQAALTLGVLFRDAPAAERSLVADALITEAAREDFHRAPYLAALASLGDRRALIPILSIVRETETNEENRAWAVRCAGFLGALDGDAGPSADEVATLLLERMGDRKEDPAVLRAVPSALARIYGRCSASRRAAIVAALSRVVPADRHLRGLALVALGRLAGTAAASPEDARRAVDRLNGAAAETPARVREYALTGLAFATHGPEGARATELLSKLRTSGSIRPFIDASLCALEAPSPGRDRALRLVGTESLDPAVRARAALSLALQGVHVPALGLSVTDDASRDFADAVAIGGENQRGADWRELMDRHGTPRRQENGASWARALGVRTDDAATSAALDVRAGGNHWFGVAALVESMSPGADPFAVYLEDFPYRTPSSAVSDLREWVLRVP